MMTQHVKAPPRRICGKRPIQWEQLPECVSPFPKATRRSLQARTLVAFRIAGRSFHFTHVLTAAIVAAAAGCVPQRDDAALLFCADREHVRDAGLRRTSAAWYLRFDALRVSDLDDALATSDEAELRHRAAALCREAGALARPSIEGEIDRLSDDARRDLASRTHTAPDAATLKAHFARRADAEVNRELAEAAALPTAELRHRLRDWRAGLEPLPDDRGRTARRLLLGGLALPALIGLEQQEKRILEGTESPASIEMPVMLWCPASNDSAVGATPTNEDDLLKRWAPFIAVEWPTRRDYPEECDRIGGVRLEGSKTDFRVCVDGAAPAIYTYASTAKLHGGRFAQANYVWWFPRRPALTANDPVAGTIDGGTLRLTFDAAGRPAVAEVILSCGCGHEAWVARSLEQAALREHGPPQPGADYAIEKRGQAGRPVLVSGLFDAAPGTRLLLTLAAGSHGPRSVSFTASPRAPQRVIGEKRYDILGYDALDRLPLENGVASMFGADGLVHNAGRAEGYLLAPTGMLSAGQPRKRGTQRIRWDAYLFDEPDLLERTMRLPATFEAAATRAD